MTGTGGGDMGTRDGKKLVPEDDPDWMKFWERFPKRVAKKDARLAWAKLQPSGDVVEKILDALAWQSQQEQWVRDGGRYVPYPASWLRAERFNDEQPTNGNGKHAPRFTEWECPHIDEHASRATCEIATKLGRPRKADAEA